MTHLLTIAAMLIFSAISQAVVETDDTVRHPSLICQGEGMVVSVYAPNSLDNNYALKIESLLMGSRTIMYAGTVKTASTKGSQLFYADRLGSLRVVQAQNMTVGFLNVKSDANRYRQLTCQIIFRTMTNVNDDRMHIQPVAEYEIQPIRTLE